MCRTKMRIPMQKLSWIFLLPLILVSCSQEPPEEPVIRPVRAKMICESSTYRYRPFSGFSRAGQEARLSFKVAGNIAEVPVRAGERVKKGQLIARLDPKDYSLEVQQAEAALSRAEAEARHAQANYERVRSLYENRNASRKDLDAGRAASESGIAMVRSIKKKLEQAELQLGYTELLAPRDGDIAGVFVEVNENVAVGQPVVLLTSGSVPEISVSMPESLIGAVHIGDPVKVVFDILPDHTFEGAVMEVGVAPSGKGSTFPVIITLKQPSELILSGMAAEVTFRFPHADGSERLLVPPQAVAEDGQGRFVYVVHPDPESENLGICQRREVRVGALTHRGLEILGGLQAGELIAVAGVGRIQDGLQVRILEELGDCQ